MLKARWTLFFFVVLGLVLIPVSAKANQLAPGASGPPDTFLLGDSSSGGRTVLTTGSFAWGSGTFSGQYYGQVESDPGNVFCSGCLDFIFQVQNDLNSTEDITRIIEAGFGAYRVDVGYDLLSGGSLSCGPDDNGFCNSGDSSTVPFSVDRSLDGDVVGFNLTGVRPGDSTMDLVIETDALSFGSSLMTIHGSNGDEATLDVFAPSGPPAGTTPTPEPPTVLLLAAGLIGFLALRRK